VTLLSLNHAQYFVSSPVQALMSLLVVSPRIWNRSARSVAGKIGLLSSLWFLSR